MKKQITEQLELFPEESPNPTAGDTKATNPKDAIGSKKLGTTTVPDAIKYFAALATTEGALKYGSTNWSEAGVRCSIYLDALDRHISKFKAGEWKDPSTNVPHLSNAIACIGIIIDAHLRGKILDDRPPPNPEFVRWLDEAQENIEHLKQVFADCDPPHYTMATIGLAPEGKLYVGLETE